MTRLAPALLVALLVVAAPAAGAVEVTDAELRELAARARQDPSALDRLRQVDTVDGRDVDVGAALSGAGTNELEARLRVLAAGGTAPETLDASAARRSADDILSSDRFDPYGSLPRPFRGILRRAGDWVARAILGASGVLPGGEVTFWIVVALVAALATAVVVTVWGRRRATRAGAPAASIGGDEPEHPSHLEREARKAERAGDHERALRLLFRAGLLRLGSRGAIDYRPSLTSGEVSRRLRQPAFDRLASDFDEIVYGGRPPGAGDVEGSREGWRSVLAEAGS